MKKNVNWHRVSAFRLVRHHLVDQTQAALVTVCRDVCGVQAQLMPPAEMALWARTPSLAREDIHIALWKNRTLVRTSCMRQTLHLIPAGDFSLYINALKKERREFLAKIMSRSTGVTQKESEALNVMILEALYSGPLTQAEIVEQIWPEVGKKIKKWMELAWKIQIFRSALIEGLICYGPERSTKTTFVRVDQWLPNQSKTPEEEVQQALLRRYLGAYGPATSADFSKRMGVSIKAVQSIWKSLQDELVEISVESQKRTILRKDYETLMGWHLGGQSVRLLPHFDSYMLGHSERTHLVDAAHYKQIYRKAGWISPVVLLNGKVVGVWSYTRAGSRFSLKIEPFTRFPKIVREKIEQEAERLGDFLKTSCEVRYTKL